MAGKFIGVLLGVIFTACVVYWTPNAMRNTVVNNAPFFIGGSITGFICRDKGWLYGGMVGLIIIIIQVAIMRDILTSGRPFPFGWSWFVVTAIATILITVVGGSVGQLLRKRIAKKREC